MSALETSTLGPSTQSRLVFLHEGLGCVAMWRDFPARLSAACGLGAFVYSRAGYGKSPRTTLPRPATYMHEEAALLPGLLAEEGISLESAILFGHSDGASIALLCASANRVRGLILEAPHVFAEEAGLLSIARAREAYAQGDLRARLARYHADVDAAFLGWNEPCLSPEFKSWNLEGALPSIRAPALLIQGVQDEYGTPAQLTAIEKKSGGPVETLLLEDCGHSPHKDQPDAVLRSSVKFAASLVPVAAPLQRTP